MFKRANKITALLVAAASVMSVVPAMASDRLGTKEGTIENAVAFSDGKYVYQGYRSDSDDEGIYYNAGDKDKLLEDVQDANLTGSYEDKYAAANDGSDEYLVDLTNGDISDTNTPDDQADNAVTKLKSQLKKTDRYGTLTNADAADLLFTNAGTVGAADTASAAAGTVALTSIGSTKFGETWYEYAANPAADADSDTPKNLVVDGGLNGLLYGFTNQSGKYIDASNVANIYAYSTTKQKTVKIDEFSNDFGDIDSDTGLLASLASAPEVLAQDKDYIYAKITVEIYDGNVNALAGAGAPTACTNLPAGSLVTTHTYIQKISKAQGDVKNEAYLPKTVVSYEVALGDLNSSDADDAATVLNTAGIAYSVVNGQLLAIDATSGNNVKVTSINLKKDKVKYTVAPNKNDGSSFGTSDKVDVYLAEKDEDDDVDVDASSAPAYDVDVDGNVWVVADGKIYKFENNEMTKKYSCDSSLNSINVYDENSMITWEADGDIYTTVNEGKAETETEAAPVAPAKVGWDQLADGTWNFYDATGTKVANNWVNVGGAWYYLKADGVMATGWQNLNGTWYFLKSSGAMATGWLNDNGTWYFLNASGAMLANTTVDGYVLGASGAWVK